MGRFFYFRKLVYLPILFATLKGCIGRRSLKSVVFLCRQKKNLTFVWWFVCNCISLSLLLTLKLKHYDTLIRKI